MSVLSVLLGISCTVCTNIFYTQQVLTVHLLWAKHNESDLFIWLKAFFRKPSQFRYIKIKIKHHSDSQSLQCSKVPDVPPQWDKQQCQSAYHDPWPRKYPKYLPSLSNPLFIIIILLFSLLFFTYCLIVANLIWNYSYFYYYSLLEGYKFYDFLTW